MLPLFDYSERDNDGKKSKSCTLLVGNPDIGFHFSTIYLTKNEAAKADGSKFKFINKFGEMTYFIDDVKNLSEKYNFRNEGVRKAYQGEEDLYAAIKSYVNHDRKDEVGFLQRLEDNGMTYKDIYTNPRILMSIVNWADSGVDGAPKNALLPVMFTVTKNDGKYKQRVVFKSGLAFKSSDTIKTKMEEADKTGYPLLKDCYYTYKFQEFSEADSLFAGDNSSAPTVTKKVDTAGW